MKKWIIYIFIILSFIGISFFVFNSFNRYTTKEAVESLSISSASENQVCEVDKFNLSSIWINITYQSGKEEQVTLSNKMISKRDYKKIQKPGNHNINVRIGNKNLNLELFLYDNDTLKNQKIYCYDTNKLNCVMANSVYDLDVPVRENQYFYNWYYDEAKKIKYEDKENIVGAIKLYAQYSEEVTYRVRFFHQDILIYEEYVKRGDYAIPPTMTSFDNYQFLGWDKSFSDVQENIDIHSIYALPGCKIVYYNHRGGKILEQTINEQYDLIEPTLSKIAGQTFIGWVRIKDPIQNIIEARPIYKKDLIEVKFYSYKCGYSYYTPKFLYSIQMTAGERITCNYEIEGYKRQSYSIGYFDETNIWHQTKSFGTDSIPPYITKSTDVLVYYMPEKYYNYLEGYDGEGNKVYSSYNFDDELDSWVLGRNPDEIIANYRDYRYHLWFQVDQTTFDYSVDGMVLCDTEEFGTIPANLHTFLINPLFWVGNEKHEYVAYEWYYDEKRTEKIEDFSLLKACMTIYGKQLNLKDYITSSHIAYSYLEFIKTTINGVEGYKTRFYVPPGEFFLPQDTIVIPEEYNSLPVIAFEMPNDSGDGMIFNVYISKNVVDISIPKHLYYPVFKVFFCCDEESPYFYSKDGEIYLNSNQASYFNGN